MQACLLDADSLGPEVDLRPLLGTAFEWKLWPSTKPEDVSERIAAASVVLTNKVRITGDHFAQAKKLRYISVLATGTNNIDLLAAKQHGVGVSNVSHYSSDSVVQHTLSLMLALSGNMLSYHQDVQQKKWQESPFFCYFNRPIHGLRGKNLGIIGYGSQGQKLAAIARELGMNVHVQARDGVSRKDPDGVSRKILSELLPITDVLSFHCPLTPETSNMLHAENILQLKKSALVINCARGGLVDEAALVHALESGHLAGAGFDVATIEPPPLDHPFMKVKHPNFILTPHIAWASIESRKLLVEETAKNLQAFLKGIVQNSVSLP